MNPILLGFVFICLAHTKHVDVSSDSSTIQKELELETKLFEDFVKRYNRVYESEEEYNRRFQIFRGNLQTIKSLQENELGTAKYGVTKFADYSEEELPGSDDTCGSRLLAKKKKVELPDFALPTNFDWRHHNAVTPVRDEGNCRSYWAFSVAANIEGVWAAENRKLYQLSVQQLMDCDNSSRGCSGGDMLSALKSVYDMGGIMSEADYPYCGINKTQCSADSSKWKVSINNYVVLDVTEASLAEWLILNGPISIGMNSKFMYFYKGGVSIPKGRACLRIVNYSALIVGYGEEKIPGKVRTIPYWTIKNTWGKDWGEEGYYRLYRGINACGIMTCPTSAMV